MDNRENEKGGAEGATAAARLARDAAATPALARAATAKGGPKGTPLGYWSGAHPVSWSSREIRFSLTGWERSRRWLGAEPVAAQSVPMHMPGMTMPAHPKGKPAKRKAKKGVGKKPAKARPRKPSPNTVSPTHHAATPAQGANPTATPLPMDHSPWRFKSQSRATQAPPLGHSQIDYGAMTMPTAPQGGIVSKRRQAMRKWAICRWTSRRTATGLWRCAERWGLIR